MSNTTSTLNHDTSQQSPCLRTLEGRVLPAPADRWFAAVTAAEHPGSSCLAIAVGGALAAAEMIRALYSFHQRIGPALSEVGGDRSVRAGPDPDVSHLHLRLVGEKDSGEERERPRPKVLLRSLAFCGSQ